MKSTCPTQELLDYLIKSDKYMRVPEKLSNHALTCENCRKILARAKIQKLFKALSINTKGGIMGKFDKRVKVGTMVLIEHWGWYIVKSVHETRNWIEVWGLVGSFQRGQVLKFSNTIRGLERIRKLATQEYKKLK